MESSLGAALPCGYLPRCVLSLLVKICGKWVMRRSRPWEWRGDTWHPNRSSFAVAVG
jgi:hypothetical protein